MRIFNVLIITTTTVLLLLLCLQITSATEFIPSCETGTFLVCHFFADEDQDSSLPIELCVSEDALVSHFQFYPNDTQGSCPTLVESTTACPLACGTLCSLACRNLINTTTTTPNENMDCFDCQGTPGDPGSNAATNGIQCWDKNENHGCDLTTEDQNKDGKCTLKDCQTVLPTTTECLCVEPIKLCCYVSLFGTNPPTSNPSPILGQIRWIAWNDCQRDLQGHAPCQGQLMAATQNSALFSLMHTKYGGDGVVTFALPDFQNMKI